MKQAHTCPTAPRKAWNEWELVRELGPPVFQHVALSISLYCHYKPSAQLPDQTPRACDVWWMQGADLYSCKTIRVQSHYTHLHDLPAVICENLHIIISPSGG